MAVVSDQTSNRRYYNNNNQILKQVDQSIWRACAGTSVQIPAVDSRVYYFSQGHFEHFPYTTPSLTLSSLLTSRSSIPCRVVNVSFLADHDTDEVFAKIGLTPHLVNGKGNSNNSGDSNINSNVVVSFAKVLTPSDANNGGGFSVPRFCADSIFPPLDFTADPPVQNIRISDVHGDGWDFRHIYRGTPRRHLLTTGWSKFVNSKKLIAGDSVVFMRNKLTDQLFVGIRRAVKCNDNIGGSGGGGTASWASQYGAGSGPHNGGGGGGGGGGGFSRNGKGRVPADAVIEAAERAASNMPFEVVYYPRAGLPDFVVAAEKVESALGVYWSTGMRVKMAMETEDSSRMTWFQGTVASVLVPDSGVWSGSTWRMLQVAWDEPEILQNMKRVNPWQIEFVSPTPPTHTIFPPTKKLRVPNFSGLATDGDGDFPLPTFGLDSIMGQLNASYLNYNTFPAGMQGARQNPFFGSSVHNIINNNACRTSTNDYLDNFSQKVDTVSTDLNIGSSSSDTPSPDSQNSVELLGVDTGKHSSSGNLSKKTGITSFQLFGKIIQMEQPSTEDSNCEEEYDESTNGVTTNTMDNPFADTYKKLNDRLGTQCQRSSVVETFAL